MDKQINKEKIKISIGCDHAGFDVALEIIDFLNSLGYDVDNQGCYSSESVDYPEFGHKVGIQVANGHADKGIVVCGSGIGISIAANKVKGIRAALCFTKEHAEMSRRHNDSNILALGARMKGGDKILDIVNIWLETNFEGDRHQRRIERIEMI
jgi:ribose 5-phosphate isomerase B